jgi:hypothetical protein
MSIIKPSYMDQKKDSKNKNEIDWSQQEKAIVVNRKQLHSDKEKNLKEVKTEIEKRKSIVDVSSDEEYNELFNVVNNLIETQDFWELVPDSTIQKVYAFVTTEMIKKGISKPRLPKELKEK